MTDSEQKQREDALKSLAEYRAGKIAKSDYNSTLVQWGKAHLLEARSDIEPFLKSSDDSLRRSALDVLACRLRLQDYWMTAVRFLLYDPEMLVRLKGASALAWLQDKTGDRQTLGVLANVVRDRYDDESVREDSYRSMRIVAFGDWSSQDDFELGRDANWAFVDDCVNPALEEKWRAEAQEVLIQYRARQVAESDDYEMLLKFGRTRLHTSRDVVEHFLSSSSILLRKTAFRVLVLYLRVPESYEMAVNALQHDLDLSYREVAIDALGWLMQGTRDKKTLSLLDPFVDDDDLSSAALHAIAKITQNHLKTT